MSSNSSNQKSDEKSVIENKEVNFLTEDPKLDGQNFVCISFLQPSVDDKSKISGIKIRGVFDNYDDACKRAKDLQAMDTAFNVFVGDIGKWLAFDPDPDTSQNSNYANDELNNIMKNYLISQEKSKILHEKRNIDMTRENLKGNMETLNKQISKSEKKLNKAEVKPQVKVSLLKKVKNMKAKIKEIEGKVNNLSESHVKYDEELRKFDKPKMVLEPPTGVDLEKLNS